MWEAAAWDIQKSEEKLMNYASSSDVASSLSKQKALKPAYESLIMLC
jgi:hypothetical protein